MSARVWWGIADWIRTTETNAFETAASDYADLLEADKNICPPIPG